eukprot:TRINITY_DN6429_c0_g1_i5.p1 TRINITY_DN6429_c0_g1~~TRINITY_DN6429_c0_g1_i5.p1  ORF type:complete len:225 (+),score=42.94 TRINITY_DN6429_c0_g1_i5:463-1137(+)
MENGSCSKIETVFGCILIPDEVLSNDYNNYQLRTGTYWRDSPYFTSKTNSITEDHDRIGHKRKLNEDDCYRVMKKPKVGSIANVEHHSKLLPLFRDAVNGAASNMVKIYHRKIMETVEQDNTDLSVWQSMADSMFHINGAEYQEIWSIEDIIETGSNSAIFNNIITNNQQRILNIFDTNYLLPENSTFLMSDFENIGILVDGKCYDFIVIDPPWVNKSNNRGSK